MYRYDFTNGYKSWWSLDSQTINPSKNFRQFSQKIDFIMLTFNWKLKCYLAITIYRNFPCFWCQSSYIIIWMTRYVLLDYQIGSQTWVDIYWRPLRAALVALIIFLFLPFYLSHISHKNIWKMQLIHFFSFGPPC